MKKQKKTGVDVKSEKVLAGLYMSVCLVAYKNQYDSFRANSTTSSHISFLIHCIISYDDYTFRMPMTLALLNAFNRGSFHTVVFSFVSLRPIYRFSRTFRLNLTTTIAEHSRKDFLLFSDRRKTEHIA
uniref:Uncharacterized protein n=1 Tax=Glossina austeni TaxID=7395 RepID=A0A1A9VAW0_GLOAU